MRHTYFSSIRSGLGTGVLVLALFFQMLPFFLLLIVIAYTMGVTGGGMLVIVPAPLLAMVFAACWLASKRSSLRHGRFPAPRPVMARRTPNRRVRRGRGPVVLLKTRAERYQDLKDILGRAWR